MRPNIPLMLCNIFFAPATELFHHRRRKTIRAFRFFQRPGVPQHISPEFLCRRSYPHSARAVRRAVPKRFPLMDFSDSPNIPAVFSVRIYLDQFHYQLFLIFRNRSVFPFRRIFLNRFSCCDIFNEIAASAFRCGFEVSACHNYFRHDQSFL